MHPNVVFGVLIPLVAVLSVFGMTGLRTILRHREKMRELDYHRADSATGSVEARLARLEQAIETISIEVERNGEAQRYLTKVLAKHLPAEAQEQLPKVPLS